MTSCLLPRMQLNELLPLKVFSFTITDNDNYLTYGPGEGSAFPTFFIYFGPIELKAASRASTSTLLAT